MINWLFDSFWYHRRNNLPLIPCLLSFHGAVEASVLGGWGGWGEAQEGCEDGEALLGEDSGRTHGKFD